jgi:hypothetical protein
MTRGVLQSLRDSGIDGKYDVVDLYRQGQGKQVLGIIVINEPISSGADLREPRGADVIYLQGPDGWRTVPAQVRTVNRAIVLRPPRPEDNDLAFVNIFDHAGTGVRSPFQERHRERVL